MDAELKALEEKLGQLVQLCQQLRAENIQLRQQLAAAQNDGKRLGDKMQAAHERLEALLEKMPESMNE
jgi:cell division protein ZapB